MPTLNLEGLAAKLSKELDASLERVLGAGAFKQVFLIKQQNERLALKIAPMTGDLRARFERESTALCDCHHPAIANLRHVARYLDGPNEYWVTVEEFLPGGTLSDKLVGGPLSVSDVRHIGTTLVGALAHLHQRRLVHRDIKPANILFRSEAEPVLTDFGLVRMLGEPSLTHDFMAQGPGTPLYAAPEQLLNEKASIDWRTDQFGLALVLVECALGHHAFAANGQSPREAIVCMANRTSLPEQTMAELTKLGLSCLAKALSPWPVQRYRLPTEFAEALSGEQ
jgi:serine/threonine protein kinase